MRAPSEALITVKGLPSSDLCPSLRASTSGF
jgi:hypothetical protein